MEKHEEKDCPCFFCNCKCPDCYGWDVEFYFDGFVLKNRDDIRNHLRLEPIENDDETLDDYQDPTLKCYDCGKEFTSGISVDHLVNRCNEILADTDLENLSYIQIDIEKGGKVLTQGIYYA